jgi:hypothetical protein
METKDLEKEINKYEKKRTRGEILMVSSLCTTAASTLYTLYAGCRAYFSNIGGFIPERQEHLFYGGLALIVSSIISVNIGESITEGNYLKIRRLENELRDVS